MLWIYGVVVLVVGGICALLLHHYMRNKRAANAAIIFMIIIALFLSHFFLIPHYVAWTVENKLRTQRPFTQLVAIYAPNEYKAYLSKMQQNIVERGNANNEIYYTTQLLNNLLIQFGPKASDESLYQYLTANVAFNKKLFSIDPLLVLFHEYPDRYYNKVDLNKFNSDQLDNKMVLAAEAVIQSGMENPRPPLTPEDIKAAEAIFHSLLIDLSKEYNEADILAALQQSNASLDPKIAASIIIDLMEKMLAKGEKTVSLLLKSSFLASQDEVKK